MLHSSNEARLNNALSARGASLGILLFSLVAATGSIQNLSAQAPAPSCAYYGKLSAVNNPKHAEQPGVFHLTVPAQGNTPSTDISLLGYGAVASRTLAGFIGQDVGISGAFTGVGLGKGTLSAAHLWVSFQPSSVAGFYGGGVYIADIMHHNILFVDPTGTVSRFAGSGVAGFSSDGGPGNGTSINWPCSLAFGRDNATLYFCDMKNNRVRRISPDGTGRISPDGLGIISTVAGTGKAEYSGEGPAVRAALNQPLGLTVNESGDIYIADTNNNRIRKIDGSGDISTIAGDGEQGFGGDGGPAKSAQLNHPTGVMFRNRSVYIADTDNHRVRCVTPDGKINTVAGTGVAGNSGDGPALSVQLTFPWAFALDPGHNNILIVDKFKVRKLLSTGIISTFAGNGAPRFGLGNGGPAIDAYLQDPRGAAEDGSATVYIADLSNHQIRKVNPDGIISNLTGDWPNQCHVPPPAH